MPPRSAIVNPQGGAATDRGLAPLGAAPQRLQPQDLRAVDGLLAP